ncbi:hypothetical protein SAMN04488523_11913 [Sulfitobacter brevis]|uniref:Uncharacterized protein n=1 Tax=Sulfitobacter brevis TaxID=74348 RepID=A0A1I2G392_9RHOB|nr:hypothetical protein SAMN04488523_11913 [Sulfitobacter brevis]
MESGKNSLLEEKRLRRGHILKFISIYMRNHLMRPYDLKDLSESQKDILAVEIVNLFEDRYIRMRNKTPPNGGD